MHFKSILERLLTRELPAVLFVFILYSFVLAYVHSWTRSSHAAGAYKFGVCLVLFVDSRFANAFIDQPTRLLLLRRRSRLYRVGQKSKLLYRDRYFKGEIVVLTLNILL